MAILICEDACHAIVPALAAIKGARVLIIPSASPGRGIDRASDGELESIAQWRDILRLAAARARRLRHLCGLDWIRRRERHVGFVVHRRSAPVKSSCKPRPRNPVSCAPISTCVRSISRGHGCRCWGIWEPFCRTSCSTTSCRFRAAAVTLPVFEAPLGAPSRPGIDAPVAARLARRVSARRTGRASRNRSAPFSVSPAASIPRSPRILCARALGPDVHALRLPYRTSHAVESGDAQLVVDALGIHCRTIDISAAVDGYLQFEPDADARRRG